MKRYYQETFYAEPDTASEVKKIAVMRRIVGSEQKPEEILTVNVELPDASLIIRKLVEVLNNIERVGGITQIDGFPIDPKAKSPADLITAKQIGMINALARDTHTNAEKSCKKFMNCDIRDLSRNAASSLIDYLQQIEDKTK